MSLLIRDLRATWPHLRLAIRLAVLAVPGYLVAIAVMKLVMGASTTTVVGFAFALVAISAILVALRWTFVVTTLVTAGLTSDRAGIALRWMVAITGSAIMGWAFLVGFIPFEDRPAALLWVVVIPTTMAIVAAFPTRGAIKGTTLGVLTVALVWTLLMPFGITRDQITSRASQAWGVMTGIFESERGSEEEGSEEVALTTSIPTTTLAPVYLPCIETTAYIYPPELQQLEEGMYQVALRTGCKTSYIVLPDFPERTNVYWEAIGGCIWFHFREGPEGTTCPKRGGETRKWGKVERAIVQFRALDPGASVLITYEVDASPP